MYTRKLKNIIQMNRLLCNFKFKMEITLNEIQSALKYLKQQQNFLEIQNIQMNRIQYNFENSHWRFKTVPILFSSV